MFSAIHKRYTYTYIPFLIFYLLFSHLLCLQFCSGAFIISFFSSHFCLSTHFWRIYSLLSIRNEQHYLLCWLADKKHNRVATNLKLYLIPFFLVTHHYNFLMKIHGNFYISWHQNYNHVRLFYISFFLSVGSSHFILVIFAMITHVNVTEVMNCVEASEWKRKREINMRWKRWWWIYH